MTMSTKNDNSDFFERKTMDFYRKAGRENLPWRKAGITAYEVWVSEIMLQQTQVSRVTDYYVKFLRRFPGTRDVAVATWEEFLPYYAGLGYYRRGRNMLLTARKVMEEFGGEFPRDKKLLMSLPGVGDYTASAILSFAYGENFVAWDTNLKRVIGRFFLGSKDADFADMRFETHAKELNAALMDFGSAICLGRPKCGACPLSGQCVYVSEDGSRERNVSVGEKKTGSERRTDWKNAQAYVWLHRDHTLYYSSVHGRFEVFALSEAYNSRAGVKAYFKERYGLDVAVRPPHAKVMADGKPTLFVNAQVLLGEPTFPTFSKDAVKRYNEDMIL